jgi:hypothetical protein
MIGNCLQDTSAPDEQMGAEAMMIIALGGAFTEDRRQSSPVRAAVEFGSEPHGRKRERSDGAGVNYSRSISTDTAEVSSNFLFVFCSSCVRVGEFRACIWLCVCAYAHVCM